MAAPTQVELAIRMCGFGNPNLEAGRTTSRFNPMVTASDCIAMRTGRRVFWRA
jgi:hypothetical protein